MATAQQIAAWAAGAEARGIIPHRPIGPPDWQAKGALLSFMVVNGYSNEHAGQLPPSDAAFLAWAAAPWVNNPNLRRYWPPGSVDVKSDGSRNAPPWDWNPMGCPGGVGCNDDDWMNHAPWPADPVAVVPGTPTPQPGPGGQMPSAPAPPGSPGGLGRVTIPGVGPVDTAVVLVGGAAALGMVLLLSGRRR